MLNIVTGDYLQGLATQGPLVFEGAQGVLLDEWFGFHPHTTWSTTTSHNAHLLLDEIGSNQSSRSTLGLVRTHTVRHGAGPHPTEDTSLISRLSELHNTHNDWQQSFRIGIFDAVVHRYALRVCDVDALVVGHLDWTGQVWQAADAYLTSDGVLADLPLGPKGDLQFRSG